MPTAMSHFPTKSSVLRSLLLVLLVPAIGACSFISKEIGGEFTSSAVALFQGNSEPHVDDILAALGPPQAISALPHGYVFIYQHFEIMERQLGINSDENFLRWFKLALADAEYEVDTLLIHLDRNDRTLGFGLATTREDLGEAGSLMFALNFLSMIDTQELDRDVWGASHWGMFLLQPPQIALNYQSSMDTGRDGLELRGTPKNVGQRTLEYRK